MGKNLKNNPFNIFSFSLLRSWKTSKAGSASEISIFENIFSPIYIYVQHYQWDKDFSHLFYNGIGWGSICSALSVTAESQIHFTLSG